MRLRGNCCSNWKGAEGRHVSRGKFSPVGKHGRKNGSDLTRSELEKTVTGAPRERIFETPGQTGVQGGPLDRRA